MCVELDLPWAVDNELEERRSGGMRRSRGEQEAHVVVLEVS